MLFYSLTLSYVISICLALSCLQGNCLQLPAVIKMKLTFELENLCLFYCSAHGYKAHYDLISSKAGLRGNVVMTAM